MSRSQPGIDSPNGRLIREFRSAGQRPLCAYGRSDRQLSS